MKKIKKIMNQCLLEINRFSCEKLVNENTPPTFIFHTAVDTTVPVNNSLCYAKALAENKISFELHIYPYGSHGLATADILTLNNVNEEIIHTGAWINDLKKWLGFMLNHKTN